MYLLENYDTIRRIEVELGGSEGQEFKAAASYDHFIALQPRQQSEIPSLFKISKNILKKELERHSLVNSGYL